MRRPAMKVRASRGKMIQLYMNPRISIATSHTGQFKKWVEVAHLLVFSWATSFASSFLA